MSLINIHISGRVGGQILSIILNLDYMCELYDNDPEGAFVFGSSRKLSQWESSACQMSVKVV